MPTKVMISNIYIKNKFNFGGCTIVFWLFKKKRNRNMKLNPVFKP